MRLVRNRKKAISFFDVFDNLPRRCRDLINEKYHDPHVWFAVNQHISDNRADKLDSFFEAKGYYRVSGVQQEDDITSSTEPDTNHSVSAFGD